MKRNRVDIIGLFQAAQFVGVLCVIVGLFHSRVLSSTGTAVLFLGAGGVFALRKDRQVRLRITPSNIWIAYFAVYAAAAAFSGGAKVWLDVLRVKLPFLLIPLAFALSPLSQKRIQVSIIVFSCSVSGIAVATLANYIRYYEEFQTLLAKSQPIPVIAFDLHNSHIYFGVALAFSALACLYLSWNHKNRFHKYERAALLILGIFQLVVLHIVGARTGLGAIYVGLLLGALYIGVQRKKYAIIGGILLFSLAGPVAALTFSPSLRHRVDSARKDLRSYADDDWITFSSIARRLAAWEAGKKVFIAQPFNGAGPHKGERKAKMDEHYDNETYVLLEEMRLYNMHNQYFEELMTLGAINGLFFLFLIAYPLIKYRLKTEPLFVVFFGVVASVMLAESILERQTGVLFFILFWRLLLQKEKN